ncbi:MAG: UvrD-helicase domain-containing protein [Elusimicrobiota bacterium]|jgi:DNA helicase-4|nr:UvrD-helicase domain-containing protein [Elusimicrobiota bacterium]
MPAILICAIFCLLGFSLGFVYKMCEQRKYSNEVYLKNLEKAKQFINLLDCLSGYITYLQRDNLLAAYAEAAAFFNAKDSYYKREPIVKKFNELFKNMHVFIRDHNEKYVHESLKKYESFFDNIEGKSLDAQQRRAVVVDEHSNLIIAAAGSGKTLTIIAKLKYLIEIEKVDPSKILVLSFTKKTVQDLNLRLKKLNLNAQALTFHKLGFDIIKKHQRNSPVVSKRESLYQAIDSYFADDILENDRQAKALVEFLACYCVLAKEYDKFESAGKRIQHYFGTDYETLLSKVKTGQDIKTMVGQKVKSVEELKIANFLFLNGIKYDYERKYPKCDFSYRPNFYLPDYDIWIEHFGIDKAERAVWLSDTAEKEYLRLIYKKRALHKKNNTKLIETYSYENAQDMLLENLKEKLAKCGLKFRQANIKDIYNVIVKMGKDYGAQLKELIAAFINLSKSRKLKFEQIEEIFNAPNENKFMQERNRLFCCFGLAILKKYQGQLKKTNEIDFNDMINLATDFICQNGGVNYQYIIIDEYQDISFSRFNLINAIRQKTNAKLLCVGDDWQSIYRFAGSDISLFANFANFVGEYEKLFIETTHRNAMELTQTASAFISKNVSQISKNPISKLSKNDPIKFVQYTGETFYDSFLKTIKIIVQNYGKEKNILVLARHGFDLDRLLFSQPKVRRKGIKFDKNSGALFIDEFLDININFQTVHRSKGLEADNVIILNMENNQYGFPNKLSDDPLLSLLLGQKEDFLYAEERRLFYVALTRTKNEAFLMVPEFNESEFALEIIKEPKYLFSNSNKSKPVNCLWCKSGKLIVRQNPKTSEKFLGCSNFPHCNMSYKEIDILKNPIICNKCQTGFLVKRKNKDKEFLGCTNWKPNGAGCNNTINL